MDRAGWTEMPPEEDLGLSCLEEGFFSGVNSKCKDPERGTRLVCSKKRNGCQCGGDNVSKAGMRRQDERSKRGMGHMAPRRLLAFTLSRKERY